MNYRRVRHYIIFTVILILFMHLYMKVHVEYLRAWPESNQALMSSLSMFSLQHLGALVLNIIMGMIFGIEGFLKNMQSGGQWHIDIKRLLLIGIPSLLLSIEFFHFFLLDTFLLNKVMGISTMYLIAPAREPFFRFLVGYIILTSIYKE